MDYSLYVCEKKEKERKTYINFEFSGEGEGAQNNKVLEKLRNHKKVVPVNQPILIWTYGRCFQGSGANPSNKVENSQVVFNRE